MQLNDATINMIQKWITGNDEADAKSLKRTFRSVGMSISEWREAVAVAKARMSQAGS